MPAVALRRTLDATVRLLILLVLAAAFAPPELRASEFVSDLLLVLDESLVGGDVCSDALQLH